MTQWLNKIVSITLLTLCLFTFSFVSAEDMQHNPILKVNSFASNLYLSFGVGEVTNKGGLDQTSSVISEVEPYNYTSKQQLSSSTLSSTLWLGYHLLTMGHFTLSPEIYYSAASHSNKKQLDTGTTEIIGTESTRYYNQYGTDLKLGYQFHSSYNIYVKLGWGIMPQSSSSNLAMKGEGNDPDINASASSSKALQGLLFGAGLTHSLNKNSSLFIDWSELMAGDINMSGTAVISQGHNIHLNNQTQIKNLTSSKVQIGYSYSF